MAGSRAGCLAVRDFFCLYNRAESGLGVFFNVCNVSTLPYLYVALLFTISQAFSGWFYRFKDYKGPASNSSYHVPACDTGGKCSGFYHAPEHTPQHPAGNAMQGSCDVECDCGDNPCGAYGVASLTCLPDSGMHSPCSAVRCSVRL